MSTGLKKKKKKNNKYFKILKKHGDLKLMETSDTAAENSAIILMLSKGGIHSEEDVTKYLESKSVSISIELKTTLRNLTLRKLINARIIGVGKQSTMIYWIAVGQVCLPYSACFPFGLNYFIRVSTPIHVVVLIIILYYHDSQS